MLAIFLKSSRRPLLAVASALVLSGPALGQEETYKPGGSKPPAKQPKDKIKKEGEALFGGGKGGGEAAKGSEAAMWSIVLAAFRGDEQAVRAKAALDLVRGAGLTQAYMDQRGEATVVAFGRYSDPASKEAAGDLERIKGMDVSVEGTVRKEFANSFLSPPADLHGQKADWDLRNAKKLNGNWALYTLQIGVYSREDKKAPTAADLAEFRKTAEEATAKLRREGEQAFYYHGPNRSMVTIGLWGDDDYDAATHLDKSPSLHALRQRFPYNLQNGMGIKQRLKITDPKSGNQVVKEKLQTSNLVSVPKD